MTPRGCAQIVAIALGVYFGLVFAAGGADRPDSKESLGYYAPSVRVYVPSVRVARATSSYTARAKLADANEGIADTDIAYISLIIQGDNGRGYGVMVGGDRDLEIVKFLESARLRHVVIRIVLEELDQ